ncbi:HAD family phosphatase [bacterium]|nr:HAD family phosphatase [bacterium]
MRTRSKPLRAVLFDLGGVLVEFDGTKPLVEMTSGRLDLEDARKFWIHSPAVRRFETGRSSAAEFAGEALKELGLSMEGQAFLEDFISWEKGLLPGAFGLLDQIRPRILTACLSNNNVLHWDLLKSRFGMDRKFHRCFLSHEIGLIKPDPELFRHVLSALGLEAEEALFLDDNPEHVQAAAGIGIVGMRVDGVAGAREALKTNKVL